jgi:hypothetical protein
MNTGQRVTGLYFGLPYWGTVKSTRPTPDYRNMIYSIALDAPLVVFNTSRDSIEIHTHSTDNTIEGAP